MEEKSRKVSTLGIIVLGLTVGITALPPSVHPKSPDSIQEKIKAEQDRLNLIKQQIHSNLEKREAAGKKRLSILKKVEQADRILYLKRQELAILELQLKENQAEIERLDGEVEEWVQKVEVTREGLRKRLRGNYKAGKKSSLALLMQAENGEELDRRLQYLKWISLEESELLKTHETSLRNLQQRREELARVQERNRATFKNKALKLKEVEKERASKKILLAELKREVESRKALIDELKESASELEKLIEGLEKKKPHLSRKGKFPMEKGRLDWPISGSVVGFFGKQKHPKFDTQVFKKGIEINAKQGDPIQAVYDGTVVFADWFKGYGILIVLDHGDHYYTLYAHAAKAWVAVGERVKEKQVIGEVGETGLSQESSLYFEIRHRGKPEDPLPWLIKR